MSKAVSSRRQKSPRQSSAPQITTFSSAVKYLNERVDFERMRVIRYDEDTFRLDRMRELLEGLGNPHEQIRTVHVAGTLGKGSTVAMVGSMLEGCGYGVGVYTSPHLIDVRERITINRQKIATSDLTDLIKQAAAVADERSLEPTFFELCTAVAFKHFADQAVDIAVIETGLGGRLDSTNVITPLISAITLIDLDHMHVLGNTLQEIAREKAGIMKRGVPVLSVEQPPEVADVLREEAEKFEAPLRFLNKDIEFSCRFGTSETLGPHTRIGPSLSWSDIGVISTRLGPSSMRSVNTYTPTKSSSETTPGCEFPSSCRSR